MNDSETIQCLDLIQKLWAEWKPTDEQIDVFKSRLARLDYFAASKAIRAAYAGPAGRFNKPQLQAIMEAVPAGPAGQSRHSGLHDGHPGMYVQCAALDDKGRGHPGDFKTLFWPTHVEMPPQSVVMQAMEAFRAEQQALYGGTWQLIRDFAGRVSETQMCQRRAELRGSRNLCVRDERGRWVRRPAGEQPEAEYRGTPTRTEPIRQAVAEFMAGAKPQSSPSADARLVTR